MPSELLDHMKSLLPDVNTLFEVILLDTLPANARDAALRQTGVESMAATANLVVLENRAMASSEHSISALSLPPSVEHPMV